MELRWMFRLPVDIERIGTVCMVHLPRQKLNSCEARRMNFFLPDMHVIDNIPYECALYIMRGSPNI